MAKKEIKKSLSKKDYEFMHSLSAAVLEVAPTRLRIVLYFWVAAIVIFLIWANFAKIDEIARGNGEVIPSGENQMIQNLEGGIVEEILVQEGQEVEKGQVLIKIDNQKSVSSYSSNEIKAEALQAQILRLKAESTGQKFIVPPDLKKRLAQFIDNEKSLYNTNKQQLNSKLNALREKLAQKKQELAEAYSQRDHLESSYSMISREVRMTRPMVAKGVRSKIDFLKLQREANDIASKYDAVKKSIPRLKSAIKEVQSNIKETKLNFQSEAKTKMNEAVAELKGLQVASTALEDQVTRTIVKSPMKGIVQKLYVHTVGGVIKPGEDIMEIVPSDETLLVKVNIKPKDIAFIYLGQRAIVKFTAYDFSIYGGLEGKVVLISPDSFKDEEGNVFYEVRIKTDKNYIGRHGKKLKIIPGMTTTVDIITGKKSVLDYILKPILKTKQYTFTER
ncbi:HlyD family type I secretion periplasmic adaptor subunit [Sulfurimonas paralvinellae]|uniref:HlyD family type I secretion periplasmic adaptor subunit n=1 Tax=Sulfurimonas paralvinellae TaxID=317658 RepID=A0A7M1BAP7_9BACT|nr:HlyD family type I secretion periplasmic adaptor subunit [Sulfurimonas paralvinellae]QOP46691.1 HlyD family type I secretion periplasmic adaptor subunit [Sulfurimonas paralvinellae]